MAELEEADDDQDLQLLKFQRLQATVGSILRRDPASCVALAERFLVVGLASGEVYCFDTMGQELARWRPHGQPVGDFLVHVVHFASAPVL